MSNIIENVPNDIANSSAATWGELMSEIGENFDTSDSNATLMDWATRKGLLEALGPCLLPGTPSTFLTGNGTATWTLASGTIAAVPQGSSPDYDGLVLVELDEDLTQGATTSATNYVWLKQASGTGVRSLVVTTSATVPDDCIFVGSAAVTTTIGTITQAKVRATRHANSRMVCMPLPAFGANATTHGPIIPMASGRPVSVAKVALSCETVPSDADGACTCMLVARNPTTDTERDLLASAIDCESIVTMETAQGTLTSTAADLVIEADETVYAELVNDSAVIDANWTNAVLTLWLEDLS